jgi:hypothetical protein
MIRLKTVLNPKMKFKWIEEHWSDEDARDAEKWMEEAVSG